MIWIWFYFAIEFRLKSNRRHQIWRWNIFIPKRILRSTTAGWLEATRQVLFLCWRKIVESERNRRAGCWGRSGAAGNWTQQTCKCLDKTWLISLLRVLTLNNFFQIIESEDSSSSSDTIQKPVNINHHQHQSSNLIPKNLEALLKSIAGDPSMTSLESMAAAQLAAFQRLPELNQLNSFYPSRCLVEFAEISENVF